MPRPAVLATRAAALLFILVVSLAASCWRPNVHIDSPATGTFVTGTSVEVSGHIPAANHFETLSINGVPVQFDEDFLFTVQVPVDPAKVLERLILTGVTWQGEVFTDSVMVVVADGVSSSFVLDGDPSPSGVALRIADTGLGQIAPIVESLSGDSLDISDLIAGQNPIAQGSMSGISYAANVVEVGFGGFGMNADTDAAGLTMDIQIDDFFLEIDLDLGWLGSCTLEIESSTTNITGTYDLSPLASDPSYVDVNLVSPVGVALGGFGSQFVSGICDDPLIGDIVNLIIGQGEIQQLMQDGFEDNLGDPDGAGPLDSPLASALETALSGISIAGPVGEALGGNLQAEIVTASEDIDGLTILADAAVTTSAPDPDAPDLLGSYSVISSAPGFTALTPDQQLPYGMAFAISTSAMNQLLKTQIENGLLRSEIAEFSGLPLTAGLLATLFPGLSVIPPATPLVIRLAPTIAPIFTGNPGPGGEFAELKIGALEVGIFEAGENDAFLLLEVDLDAGLDLTFTQAGLEFALATPAPADIGIFITDNPLAMDPAGLVATFQSLFPLFAPELENAIDAFPVPSLLGLELAPIEVAQVSGGFIGLFADLTATPTTHLANVAFTDLSSGDFRQEGGCWIREWRHRLSGQAFGNTIAANLKGMLGADAGCTTNDASSSATSAYRIQFDIVSVPGEQWTLDIDHSILGAFDRISDGYNDGIGFRDGGGTATIVGNTVGGSYAIAGGASGGFGFAPSVANISDGIGGSSSSQDVEFSGANGTTLTGTGNVSVTLDFQVQLDAFSNSNTAFPTANGDEMAIRLGKNDTIDNNFTAGGYPGMGSRNIAGDGHKAMVVLSSAPLP